MIQGYQTGILHHRSAREKVTTYASKQGLPGSATAALDQHIALAMKPGFIPFIGSHDDVTRSVSAAQAMNGSLRPLK